MASGSTTAEPGSIERAVQLLKLLATAGKRGRALTQLAEATTLPHSTVHRLLRRLMHEHLVIQKESDKWYALGPLAFELGLAAMAAYDLREHCRGSLDRLAEEVGDTVYLSVRSGSESVCEARHEGPSPIRVNTLSIGSRRPLGLGAGGLAILAYLPDAEREDIIAADGRRICEEGRLTEADLRTAIEACRRQGHSLIRNRVTLGVTAAGVPIRDTLGRPIAAISVAAIDDRMCEERVASLARRLHEHAREIEGSLRGRPA